MNAKGTDTAYLERVTQEGVAIVTLDHYPVNSLSTHLTNGLTRAILIIEDGVKKKEIKGVVLRGAGRCFCAGADISAFGSSDNVKRASLGRSSSDNFGFEELNVPVVAAIHGFALGGGFELSLGCHYRVMDSKAKVGLPEVNIGLLPGAQGTQRLPRLIGAENALQLMLTGNHISAKQALQFGVVDKIVENGGDLIQSAIDFCLQKINSKEDVRRISLIPPPKPIDFDKWTQLMNKKRKGEPAPHSIINCVRGACNGPTFEHGVIIEKENFIPLITSPESKALRHVFFAERNGAKVDGLHARPTPIRTVGIVGAGLMGGGIAMSCANVGIKVLIVDINQKGLDRGMSLIQSNYERSRSMTSKQKDVALSMITPSTNYNDLSNCDLIVEAVFEDLQVKKKIFQKLNKICKKDAYICSNTSALDIDILADQLDDPSRCMGTHFFSPANVMKLLENVRAKNTSDVTIASMMAWGKKIGKWVILVGNCRGFVGNRMVSLYSAQARAMLEEGLYPSTIDSAATNFGMRIGPLSMSDLVGLDLGSGALKKAGLWNPSKKIEHALVEKGRKGQKTGAGFYDYDSLRNQKSSPIVRQMIDQMFKKKKDTNNLDENEIQNRLFFPLINEGFNILQEGFARRPADIDVCYIHGYNFPRYRGGPMFHADAVGLPLVKETLEKLDIKPSKLLIDCIDSNMTLTKYWAKYGHVILKKAGPPKRRNEGKSKL